jgi:nitrite reductase (cytochrome c-552)
MALRVTRPAFMRAMNELARAEGKLDYDVSRDATRAELRTFVCAQCHVEYYFAGSSKRLVYPWAKGVRADQILAYYEELEQRDWTHALTGAAMLKAQHPEYELWRQGTHARAGVSCVDCHMPYERVGATKVTDHQVESPLLKIDRACQTCHRTSEQELRERAETIQERTGELQQRALGSRRRAGISGGERSCSTS